MFSLTRLYNFLTDYNAQIPIDDRRIDAELNQLITEVNLPASVEVNVADEALTLVTYTHLLDSSGAVRAWTLAAGTEGQEKYILMTVAGNNGVVTVTNLFGSNSTLTFDAADEAVFLKYTNSEWNIINNIGSVTIA